MSGFQLNLEKSVILNLSVPLRVLLQAALTIQWATQSIPYLCISIASSFSTTAQLNYSSLLTSTKDDLRRWSNMGLSWFGRIAAVKMTTLPRLLHVFQALPTPPPQGLLSLIQKEINAFIWERRQPRMSVMLSQRHSRDAGLGVPDVVRYYQASQLVPLVEWPRKCTEKHRCRMEQQIAGIHIWKIPWLRRRHRPWGIYSSAIIGPLCQFG